MSRCALFRRLAEAERVVQISAPVGCGKTVLMRSWIAEAGLEEHAAWVPADSEERDPQRFWLSVLGALRQTAPGAALVRALTAAPGLDGWAIVERLLTDLAPLADRFWLVIDDVHELGPDALRQLELFIMRAPPGLRFALATRRDLRLGLHRLRLEGELTEIREPDLRLSVAEARALFAAAGVDLPDAALASLHERTEGWAAGLRLAALSLAGHPDPARFAAGFSGTERTVAEYLIAEVLDRQRDVVRRLLLRTSILKGVNGELADLLTGDKGGERVLQDLEQANAFVISLDGSRSWFRYHRMFAGLLRLELRRAAPDEVAALHRMAAGWLAEHGYPVEATRHAQAAGDWGLAAQPATGHAIRYLRGLFELARGRDADALAAFRAAEPLARRLAAPHYTAPRARALLVHALVRLGDTEGAEQAVAELGSQDRDHGETRIATAVLRLAQDDPQGAVAALAPVLDAAPAVLPWIGQAHAFLLDAMAREALGDPAAAGRALERALDLAEPDGAVTIFLLHPAPGLLQRHARHGTAHAALIAEIQGLLAGNRSAPRPGSQAGWARSRGLEEPLTDSETRVLRYLPTNLTGPEIANELFLSMNTVGTHMRHLYAKLGVHSRRDAVDRARALGLLARAPADQGRNR